MFNLKFTTSNAAFRDPYDGSEDKLSERIECIRILNRIVREFADGETHGSIMDTNGNKIGEWSNE